MRNCHEESETDLDLMSLGRSCASLFLGVLKAFVKGFLSFVKGEAMGKTYRENIGIPLF